MTEQAPTDNGEQAVSAEGRVRAAAFALAHAAALGKPDYMAEAGIEIAGLHAGLDPDKRDPSDPQYLLGASEALSSALHSTWEMTIGEDIRGYLEDPQHAQLFSRVAAKGLERDLLRYEEMEGWSGVPSMIRNMKEIGLIEPALAPKKYNGMKAWQLSPGGRQVYLELLPELASTIGIDSTLAGLRGLLKREQQAPPSVH